MVNINYDPDRGLASRFINHARLALATDLGKGRAEPNLIEKVGNLTLSLLNTLPDTVHKIGKSFQDPRVVTIGLTALALLAVSFGFYPALTGALTKSAFVFAAKFVTQVPFWAVKFTAYLATCSMIVGFSLRAEGRFTNASLMKQFYKLEAHHPGNPSMMTAAEILAARSAEKAT